MSKYQIFTGRKLKCKHCKEEVALKLLTPLNDFVEIAKKFQISHAECSIIMSIRDRNRKRYSLHRQCRKAGLTVIAKDREVQGWDEANLPTPAKRLLNEFQYNFQCSIAA